MNKSTPFPVLTGRQADVLNFIRMRYRKDGVPPSFREIAEHFMVSVNAVCGYARALRTKGHVRESPGHFARTMIPVVPTGHCPCCGLRTKEQR